MRKSAIVLLLIVCLGIPTVAFALPTGGTGLLSSLTDTLSSAVVSQSNVTHTIAFSEQAGGTADSVEITIHNTADTPSSIANYDLGSASLVSTDIWSSGTYTLTHPSANVLLITRNEGSSNVAGGSREIVLSSITNAGTSGLYYFTVATKDGATYKDAGTSTFFLVPSLPVQVTVPQSFSFQITDNGVKDNATDDVLDSNISFGNIQGTVSSHPTSGGGTDGHKLVVTTNAGNGYSITLSDEATGLALQGAAPLTTDRLVDDRLNPTNDVVADYTSATAPADGEEAFYFQVSGAHVASGIDPYTSLPGTTPKTIVQSSGVATNEVHTVMYGAMVNPKTPLGVYHDTVTYTAVPSF